MKKITCCFSFLLMLVLLLTAIGFTAQAAVSGDYDYEVQADGTAVITGYNGSSTDPAIPCTIDGYTVTAIGDNAFAGYSSLNSVMFPEGITKIGDYAFMLDSALSHVFLPSTLSAIGTNPFWGCDSLMSIDVSAANPNYLSEDGVLYDRERKTLYAYPAGRTDSAFTVPYGVESIAQQAFYRCTQISSVELPETLLSIDTAAFAETGLTQITLPDSLRKIGSNPFNGCAALTEISTTPKNHCFGTVSGILYDKTERAAVCAPAGLAITEVEIPNGILTVGESAFNGCTHIESVILPDTVTDLKHSAFAYCTGLKEIALPKALKVIGNDVFMGCTVLASITIPETVESIGEFAFYGCEALTSLTIPDSVTALGGYLCNGCTALETIVIGKNVNVIEEDAFSYCSNLKEIHIPASVVQIADDCAPFRGINPTLIVEPDSYAEQYAIANHMEYRYA